MCMIDGAFDWEFFEEKNPTARKQHTCGECRRDILPGEKYSYAAGRIEGEFEQYKTCAHCRTAAALLITHCGGFVYESVQEDLVDHMDESLPWSSEAKTYVEAMFRRWQRKDGAGLMPVPNA